MSRQEVSRSHHSLSLYGEEMQWLSSCLYFLFFLPLLHFFPIRLTGPFFCVPQKKKTLFKNPYLPYMFISLYLEMKREVKRHLICIIVVFRCQLSAL